MASKTFILGAGFSAGAGFPLVRNLRSEVLEFARTTTDPLLKALIGSGQFQDEIQSVDSCGSMGYEEILLALRCVRRGESHCAVPYLLRTLCAKLLCEKQKAIGSLPDTYRNFGSWMNELHGVGSRNAIVSLNWDLLAERALQDNDVPWGYSTCYPIPVIKPHGSINWSRHLEEGLKAACSAWQRISKESRYSCIPPNPSDPSSIGPFSDPFEDGVNADLGYMVFPGDPEDEKDKNDKNGTSELWGEAEKVIKERKVVVFIGYSLPPYDTPARDFFLRTTNGKAIEVYTDSVQVLDNYRNLLPDENILTKEPITFESCQYALNRFI